MRRATADTTGAETAHENFYPRSPCGERQCTPWNSPVLCYFYPRSPCGERPGSVSGISSSNAISIHALLAESDGAIGQLQCVLGYFYPRSPCGERHDTSSLMQCQVKFLSTLSLRRATCNFTQKRRPLHNFYPRSPCGERRLPKKNRPSEGYFYPRSPCGERLMHALKLTRPMLFLSTLSLRRATQQPAGEKQRT